MSVPTCRHCNEALGHQQEKALDGEVQMVWASVLTGEWVCMINGDEHCPTHLPCAHTAAVPDEAPGTVDYEQVAHMIQDLRGELEDRIETLQREVDELRERLE